MVSGRCQGIHIDEQSVFGAAVLQPRTSQPAVRRVDCVGNSERQEVEEENREDLTPDLTVEVIAFRPLRGLAVRATKSIVPQCRCRQIYLVTDVS